MLKFLLNTPNGPFATSYYVIDAHSHMGKDVDGAEMMNPQNPGTGTFDFWSKIENALLSEWEKGVGSAAVFVSMKGQRVKAEIRFEQMPQVKKLFTALQKRNKTGQFTEFADRIKHQQLVDQAVCFPFQDIFRDKLPEARYRASNTNIARQVGKFPVSLRMIGYMRCDPGQGQKALDEIDYWAKSGVIRGLKLHPRSEAWVDHINSPNAIQVLKKAAEYSLPVIFDTRGKQSILDIGSLIRATRQTLQSQAPQLLPHLKVRKQLGRLTLKGLAAESNPTHMVN